MQTITSWNKIKIIKTGKKKENKNYHIKTLPTFVSCLRIKKKKKQPDL